MPVQKRWQGSELAILDMLIIKRYAGRVLIPTIKYKDLWSAFIISCIFLFISLKNKIWILVAGNTNNERLKLLKIVMGGEMQEYV